MRISRRSLLQLLAAAGLRADPSPHTLDQLRETCATGSRQARGYRADAVITVLGVSLFSRAGVGAGFVTLQETASPDRRATLLQFGAGSIPARARGLNRLGFLEEAMVETPESFQAAYFGFMTSSPEESFADARKAVDAPDAAGDPQYAVAEGSLSRTRMWSSVARLSAPASYGWGDCAPLIRKVRGAFRAARTDRRELPLPEPNTFLRSLLAAIRGPRREFACTYVYNAAQYRLQTRKTADPGAGRKLAARGLAQDAERVSAIRGEVRKLGTSRSTHFQLWVEDKPGGSSLPLRIELQARSYLKLGFEQDPTIPPIELEHS